MTLFENYSKILTYEILPYSGFLRKFIGDETIELHNIFLSFDCGRAVTIYAGIIL